MKKLLFTLPFFFALCAGAQCLPADFFADTYSVISVKDDASFNCHAVRLNENWFLTAAHCVFAAGQGENLVSFNGSLPVPAHIFIKQAYFSGQKAADDLALINAGGIPGPYVKQTFITFENKDYSVKDIFSAAFIGPGGVAVSCINGKGWYVKDNGEGVIGGFYLGEGYSGGGIWDAWGNLLGIISGGGGKNCYFAPFNADNLNFIQSHVSVFNKKPAPLPAETAE